MKNINSLLIIFFLLFNLNAKAASTIAYVDLQLIMNKSEPGIFINKVIQSLNVKSDKIFLDRAETLKKKEEDLLKKKNLIEQKEFEKQYIKIKSDVDDYNNEKNIAVQKIRNKVLTLNSKFLKKIKPILVDYSESKKISFLLQKKNIILGSKEFDITNDIILIVNKKINKNDFK